MSIRLPGINIQQPWSQLLLSGEKAIETRTYRLPDKYVGKPFWLVETPGLDRSHVATVIGVITFGGAIEYLTKKQFADDFDRHLVPVDHPLFGFRLNRAKYGWTVLSVSGVEPFEPAVRRGIVYTSPFPRPNPILIKRL